MKVNDWNDVLVIVTGKWAELKLNDQATVEESFTGKLDRTVTLDGVLVVGANKHGSDGFHGEMAVLRKNFKAFNLFPLKGWSGRGVPSKSKNIGKISLPTNVRHPNFQGRYYSHLFYRKSNFIQVNAVVQVTSSNGLLFFNGGDHSSSFVSVALDSGTINFCLSCADKAECRKAYEIKTYSWFLLSFVVKDNEGVIRMNNGDAMQIMCADKTKFTPRSSLYVGGAKGNDWDTIVDLTKNSGMIRGLIDTLHLNGDAISFKMATLISTAGVVNSLGYSLADHVTEVFGHHKSLTTLRCAFPESAKAAHFTRLIWMKNMVLLKSTEHAEIVDTDSTDKTVSTLNLFPTRPSDGVYACIESSDGELSVLHVFLVLLHGNRVEDPEGESEWILFIILVVFITLILLAILVYCYFEKLRQLCSKEKGTDKKEEEEEEEEVDTTDIDEPSDEDLEMNEKMESNEAIEEITGARRSYQNMQQPELLNIKDRNKAFNNLIRKSLDNLKQSLHERKDRDCIFISRPKPYGYRRLPSIQTCLMRSAQQPSRGLGQQVGMHRSLSQPCSMHSGKHPCKPISPIHPCSPAGQILPINPYAKSSGQHPVKQILPTDPCCRTLSQQPAQQVSPFHPCSRTLGQQPSRQISPLHPCSHPGQISPINPRSKSLGKHPVRQISPIHSCSRMLGQVPAGHILPINPCSRTLGQRPARQISLIHSCSTPGKISLINPSSKSSSQHPDGKILPIHPCSPPGQISPINPCSRTSGQRPARQISPIHPCSPPGQISPVNLCSRTSDQQPARQISPIHPCSPPGQISPVNPCSKTSGQRPARQISPIHPCSPPGQISPINPYVRTSGQRPARQISPMSSNQPFVYRGLGPNLYPCAFSGVGKPDTGMLSPTSCSSWSKSIPELNCEDKWTKPLPICFEDQLFQDPAVLPTAPRIPSIDLLRFSPTNHQNQEYSLIMNTLRISPASPQGKAKSSTPLFQYSCITPVNVMQTDALRGFQGPDHMCSIPLPPPSEPLNNKQQAATSTENISKPVKSPEKKKVTFIMTENSTMEK